jgi:hypothetical protein
VRCARVFVGVDARARTRVERTRGRATTPHSSAREARARRLRAFEHVFDRSRRARDAMAPSDDERPRAAERTAKKEKKEKKEKKDKRDRDGDGEGAAKGAPATPVEVHTLFFGQMPFDTKSSDIMPWLKANLTRHGCGFDIKDIRMAGGDGTGTPGKAKKFKGYAFVDFTTNKAAKKAMKLHQTLFRGRPVTVERCARKEYAAPKSEKRKRAAEGGGEGADGEPEKKMLKTLVEPDAVKAMVAEAAENSEGTLAANDCDEKVLSFLGLLPSDVCQKAVNEIKKVCMKGNQAKNKGAYFMGIIRKVSKTSWEERAKADAAKAKGAAES